MEKVKISIINLDLEEMGVDTDETTTFYFDRSCFSGFWVAKNDDGSKEIHFYVDSNKFITPYDEETVAKFKEYLT